MLFFALPPAKYRFYDVAISFLCNPSRHGVVLEQYLRSCRSEASYSRWSVRSVTVNVLFRTFQKVLGSGSEVSTGYDDSG